MTDTEEETFGLQTNKPRIIKSKSIINYHHQPLTPDTPQKKKTKVFVISAIDSLISVLLIAPLVVGFWRSAWELLDLYWYIFPWLETFVFAMVMHVSFLLVRPFIKDIVEDDRQAIKKKVKFVVLRRVHAWAYSMVCVMQWRGVWHVFDNITTYSTDYKLISTVFVCVCSVVCLALLRALRNSIAPPFVLVMDRSDAAFNFPTRYRTSMAEKTALYVLDCIFSVLVVGTLVVFVWRGAWVLLDDFLFPSNASLSAWSSLIIGYVAVAVAFLLQPAMRWVCDRLQGGLRLLAADLFLLFSLFGTVNVWRAIWMLLNIYFLPDNLELSCWITHWICLLLLILLGCSNSLLVRGVYIDAEEPAGKCVIFPCYYLRLIFQQERAKKLAKRFQLDDLSKRKQDIDNNIGDVNHVKNINNHAV